MRIHVEEANTVSRTFCIFIYIMYLNTFLEGYLGELYLGLLGLVLNLHWEFIEVEGQFE